VNDKAESYAVFEGKKEKYEVPGLSLNINLPLTLKCNPLLESNSTSGITEFHMS